MTATDDLGMLIRTLKVWRDAQATAVLLLGDIIQTAHDEALRKRLVTARRLIRMGELNGAIDKLEKED